VHVQVNEVEGVGVRIVLVGVSGNHAQNPHSHLTYVGLTNNRYNSLFFFQGGL